MTSMDTSLKNTREGNYVMLRAGSLRLLLPQAEVGAAEYVEGQFEALGDMGLMQRSGGGEQCFYVAMSSDMTPLPQIPEGRFLVTTLGDGSDELRWCWDEVRVLIDFDFTAQPLPPVLAAAYTPVNEFFEQDGEIIFLCDAARIAGFAFTERS